jgi:peptidyl-prolyl cis-trans isomerase C
MKVRQLIRDPLLQFIVLGVVLFGLYQLFRDESPSDDRRIVISAQQVDQLSAIFQKQWMRPPTERELQGMVDGFVREEVLYREAKSLGLDRDDTVIRRRLAQKIEFLAQDLATQVEPSDSELETFFKEHPDLFREPPRISFEHVYVSVDARGAEAAADAEKILAALRSGTDPSEQGDRFMLQRRYIGRNPDEVARHFGRGFAEELLELPRGEWIGPVESGYGLHLVFIEGVEDAYLPDFAEIRPEVRDEYFSFRRREVDEQFYSQLREGYEIVIETPGEESAGQTEAG